jgi:hypothetical protein
MWRCNGSPGSVACNADQEQDEQVMAGSSKRTAAFALQQFGSCRREVVTSNDVVRYQGCNEGSFMCMSQCASTSLPSCPCCCPAVKVEEQDWPQHLWRGHHWAEPQRGVRFCSQ